MANCVSRIKLVLSVVIRRSVSEGEGLVEELRIANCELRIVFMQLADVSKHTFCVA
jgi:hypothetical protein